MEAAFSAVASGGLNAMFSSSAASTVMQAGSSALSVLSSVTAGRVARREARSAASMNFFAASVARQQGDIDARQQEIEGRARVTQLQEDFLQTIGGQRVAFAASGVDPTRGTAARIQKQTARRSDQDVAMVKANTNISAMQTRLKAELDAMGSTIEGKTTLARGSAQQKSSWLDVAKTGFGFAADVLQRK